MIKTVKQYKELLSYQNKASRTRKFVRDAVVSVFSIGKSVSKTSGWIRFPYYHHVFDDERHGFIKQLDYLKKLGDFISLSEVVDMLESRKSIDGRYFCITFDDGFKNNFTNAFPILFERNIKATFFLPTYFIGKPSKRESSESLQFFDNPRIQIEFLSWDDCRQIIRSGMEIGSHSVNHYRLAVLDKAAVQYELAASKKTIEENLGIKCNHFCAPFGLPRRDFNPKREPVLVKAAGYRCMLTTKRGPSMRGSSPFEIRRDHTIANWGLSQLRYFLSQD